ncbi:MAG: aminotransferase, partial [Acidimicrobiales bacterium]
VEGDGCHLVDADGKRYLDAVGGLWNVQLGWGNEELVEAIADQARRLAYSSMFTDMTHDPAVNVCALLAELAPGELDHVFLSTGGSLANDSAYRLIQYYNACRGRPEKEHILALDRAYHGSTHVAMSIGGKKADHPPEFRYITDTIHHLTSPGRYRAPEQMTDDDLCERLVEELRAKIAEIGPHKVAAFFAEPIQGAGGVIVPPDGWHRRMWEVCKEHDVLYVSDEVVTAFGRLGAWFASRDVFDIEPDIIVCAKGITSGYQPLGATIFSREIFDTISEQGHGRVFTNGFTYSGHPVACAAALKNIEIIDRTGLLHHARTVGEHFGERLSTLADLPIVGDVRGMGLMRCVEFVADRETKAEFPDEVDIGRVVSRHADEMGLIVRPIVNLNVMSPPLVITHDEIDVIVDTLRDAIVAAMADLDRDGLLRL